MNDVQFNEIMKNDIETVNNALLSYLPNCDDGQNSVVKAMKYSLLNGGKRLRPIFVIEFCKACGGSIDDAIAYACAVEYIHTYSLIHDDLPCMDNDDMRRGKPSCHKMFGESTALLAGDALLTHSFEIVSSSNLSDEQNASAVLLLSQNSGVNGMIGGQVLDLLYENVAPQLNDILTVHKLKTGALISAACLLGCIAGKADSKKISVASKFAYNLGVAFQIKDDLLDVIGDETLLGKPVGSDAENDKKTYVDIVGIEKAQDDVKMLTQIAINQLSYFENTEFLHELSNRLIDRNN